MSPRYVVKFPEGTRLSPEMVDVLREQVAARPEGPWVLSGGAELSDLDAPPQMIVHQTTPATPPWLVTWCLFIGLAVFLLSIAVLYLEITR